MADVVYGTLKFTLPDPSHPLEQRAFFAFPPLKELKVETVELHDFRKDPKVVKGPAGLDAQGFTVVHHKTALSGVQWFAGSQAEDVYFPEAENLVKELTGASSVVVVNASFRRKAATERDKDPAFYRKATDKQIFDLETIISEKPKVNGKNFDQSLEPARNIHCDYSFKGLQRYVRYGRSDIATLAAEVLEAEDTAGETGKPFSGPRYAAYSVWRPLKTVRRDPLVVADYRSIAPEDFVPFEYRVPCASGEFATEAYMIKPGDAGRQKWYWLPQQSPEEALVIKLADSEASQPGVAGSTPHGSPSIPGCEGEDLRESIEVRLFAFW